MPRKASFVGEQEAEIVDVMNEIINKLNDLEQIVYDFTGHIKL